jgi:DNA-binding response OmpR family regulator
MVLAVERDSVLLDELRRWLEGHGHELLAATSVVQALRWLRTIRPDVLLLDVGGLHGVEVYRWVRTQLPAFQEMPIVFLAAPDQRWESAEGESWPRSRTIRKPITSAALGGELEALFGWNPLGTTAAPPGTPTRDETKRLPGGSDPD